MKGYINLLLGISSAVLGGIIWARHEKTKKLFSATVAMSILLILLGALNILIGIEKYLKLLENKANFKPIVKTVGWFEWILIIGMIFVASVSYTIAAYYHLKLENWSFLMAFGIALPLILIEYQFSIRGNFAAKDILKLNAVQITLITMTFYFINSWVLNAIFLKNKVVWWREILAFGFIIAAFIITTSYN